MITPQYFPSVLYVGNSRIEEFTEEPWEEVKKDPRGVLLMWHPPKKHSRYIMGVDSSEGVTGWSRATRADGDEKIDNGVVSVIEVDAISELAFATKDGQKVPVIDPVTRRQVRVYKDLQVAEFAAPCDPVEISRVANVLGGIYATAGDEKCELIVEAWPGSGLLAMQELLRLQYSNLWMWEYLDTAAEATKYPGWRSTPTSQRLLWSRFRRHLMQRRLIIRSSFLLGELSNAVIDVNKMRAMAAHGYHDDRLSATSMACWAGHKWTYDVDRPEERVGETPFKETDYQQFAPTLDDYMSYSDWKENMCADLED